MVEHLTFGQGEMRTHWKFFAFKIFFKNVRYGVDALVGEEEDFIS